MNASLAHATANECDLKAQIQALQRSLHDASMSSASHSDKYKQVMLSLLHINLRITMFLNFYIILITHNKHNNLIIITIIILLCLFY